MGNAAASCAPSIISSGGVVKVLFPDGKMQIYTKPIKAADLMVENPGQFVCDSSSLKVGHRIHGLTADEVLEKRQLYFLLPMELLYSVLTNDEMTCLTCLSTKALKHSNKLMFPSVFTEFCIFPVEATKARAAEDQVLMMRNDVVITAADSVVERFSKQRSWKPALETILETPCTCTQ